MSQNISTTCCKLVALSCLNGKVKDRVWQQWTNRFHDHETFWVDVAPGQTSYEIAQTVTQMIATQGIVSLAGQALVISVFLDLTQVPNEESVTQIIQVPTILKNVLGCTVPLTLEFGYLDKMAFADKPLLRSHTQKIVQLNCAVEPRERKQLCLVATSPLVQEDDDNNWKAVIILLDVIRRMSDPASYVPMGEGSDPNNDIGFIRYGEYNEKKHQKLSDEKAKLHTALGNGGEAELKTAINLALSQIEHNIEGNYIIDGGMQPVHPDMKVDGFIAKKLAASNKNAKFKAASNATWSALQLTGKGLRQTILDDYQEKISNAANDLAKFIKDAKVGIELEADTHLMESILTPEKANLSEPMAPSLAYSEGGYTSEIEKYLKAVRKHAAAKVRQTYAQALLNAYKDIPESVFVKKRAELTKEMANVNIYLNSVLTKEDLINMVAANLPLRQTGFFPVLGGGACASFVLCRTRQDEAALNSACGSGVLYIDEKFGGLKTLDEAPICALQLLLFDCNDQRLEDLIK